MPSSGAAPVQRTPVAQQIPRHRREPRSRDSGPREGNRFRESPRDGYPREGRSPGIRKSISEATGGALDMSGPLPSDPGLPRPSDSGRSGQARAQGEGAGGRDQRGQRSPRSQGQGKKVVWITKKDEGHGYGKLENNVDLYKQIFEFLDKNIGTGPTP